MPSSSNNYKKHKDIYKHKSSQFHKFSTQHGQLHHLHGKSGKQSLLLDLPTESVTHITSFLDPVSLFALSQTSKAFHEHVGDDNTWRRAFFCRFLGISPEDDFHEGKIGESHVSLRVKDNALMLRREESSWKREFVYRWNLRRRWERTRSSSTISHSPVHSRIDDVHLMKLDLAAAPVLLSSSHTYGIVGRSQPLTGKIARGYLDAAGTLNGLGIGNPNAEFSPNMTQCAITSAGGTARILWGFRSGTVAVTVAPRATELTRSSAAQWRRCREEDAHVGSVEHASWVDGVISSEHIFVTGGADGHVKVWDADKMRCLWTSPAKVGQLVRDPCSRVSVDSSHGIIAALFESGDATIWSGLSALFSDRETPDLLNARAHHLPPTASYKSPGPYPEAGTVSRKVLAFHLQASAPEVVSLLTAYEGESFFHKTLVDVSSGQFERSVFGKELMGTITSMQPVFSPELNGERSFVLAGDVFGYINIFAWDDSPSPSPPNSPSHVPATSVAPVHRFSALNGIAVTAIHWNPVVLIAGSTYGSLRAFDATTFDLLRDFKLSFQRTLVNDSVKHIAVARDVLVATIEDRVYTWRADPPGNWKPGRGHKVIKMPNGVAKWHQNVEMYRDIAESRREMESEQTQTRRAFGREREQHYLLDTLGLSEVEAVEYVLMLSREEEVARRASATEEGMFGGQFDEDIHTPIASPSGFIEGSSRQPSSGIRYATPRTPPSLASSLGMSKIQISPRLLPEPMEAGFEAPRSLSLSSSNGDDGQSMSLEDQSHFPSMSSTPVRRSVSGSPESVRSAWSTPLRSARSSEGPSSPRGLGSLGSSPISRSPAPGMSLLSARFAQMNTSASASTSASPGLVPQPEDEDEDLKFAIELSLAEARSRGEAL